MTTSSLIAVFREGTASLAEGKVFSWVCSGQSLDWRFYLGFPSGRLAFTPTWSGRRAPLTQATAIAAEEVSFFRSLKHP